MNDLEMREAIGRVINRQERVAALHTDFNLGFDAFPDASVDMICTDPPYDVGALPLFARVYEHASRVLKPNGHLIMIVPAYCLDPMNSRLAPLVNWGKVRPAPQQKKWKPGAPFHSSSLIFRWNCTMKQDEGSHRRLPSVNKMLKVRKKDLGWWTQYPLVRRDYSVVDDSFENDPPPKGKLKLHKWQQSESWARYCLQLAEPDWLIVDPMMGAGTVPFVAREMGMRCVGMDLDAEAVATARERLNV